jgi:transcriptional regulator with XRE-family HTH domain
MKIGAVINKIRKEKGYSQVEFSALTGISQTSISLIENDITYPHQSTLLKICKALDIKEIDIYKKANKSPES